ncbi:phage portal protein [Parablautia intestinalis]|uniref:Phage portal protein n=1 Tax=Parablautia intestinalis TaxID=2320100 RepID=A0A3A9ASF1_9FIRM|nr:phage portal protein [Parablautia intestinalis]RKI94302.1 phage portal protein [Parablautia intestinalis]
MGINEYFLKAFGKQSTISIKTQIEEEFTEVFFKELATACAINMIANTIGKCEIRTFVNGVPERREEYYLWNYEPNPNENSSDFMQHFISNLCYDNEALIIELDGHLYVADSFSRRKYSFYEDIFSNIVIGDLTLQKPYRSGEVIYMQLNNIDARQRLEGAYTSYGKTVAKAVRNMLRQGAQKGILNIDAQTSQQKDFTEKLKEIMDDRFKPFYEAGNAVLPLTNGYSYTDVTKQGTASTPADINERINYEFEIAGRTWRIPKALILGDVLEVEKITKNFLTFAIDPVTEKFGKEATRKRYGTKEFRKGNYIDVNTNCIQHIDIFEQATNSDKLLSSGLYCIDELRIKLGDTAINKDWSKKHYITKNYAEAGKMAHLGDTEGGGTE